MGRHEPDRRPPDPERDVGRGRFHGEDDDRQRGYRGQDGDDTPPGSVPGGSHGGGGYRQGGYSRGNYDPSIEARRPHSGGAPKGWGGGRPSGEGGDWRRGFGGYGVSGSGHGAPDRGRGAPGGRGPFDERDYDEFRAGYGLGGPGRGEPPGQRGWDEWEWDQSGTSARDHGAHDGRGSESDLPWSYLESWAVPGPFTGRGPEGYVRSEDAIREDVCERLTRHGGLDATGIRVRVEANEVILEGSVDSRAAKRMAEDAAETVSGVRDVHNRLRLRFEDTERDDRGNAR
jgi:hypothetical protein